MGNKNINKDQFIEWFVGFTDAEGNFTISIDKRGVWEGHPISLI